MCLTLIGGVLNNIYLRFLSDFMVSLPSAFDQRSFKSLPAISGSPFQAQPISLDSHQGQYFSRALRYYLHEII